MVKQKANIKIKNVFLFILFLSPLLFSIGADIGTEVIKNDISVKLIHNTRYCHPDTCRQIYQVCHTQPAAEIYTTDFSLKKMSAETAVDVVDSGYSNYYILERQNITRTYTQNIEIACESKIGDTNSSGGNETQEVCYRQENITITTEEDVEVPFHPFSDCKRVLWKGQDLPIGHYDNIPILNGIRFDEFADFYVSYPYWVEDDNSTIWIKANATTTAPTQFYIYFNFSNGSLSSIDDTMYFGDDFNDGTINWTKWGSGLPSAYNESGGYLTLSSTTVANKIYANVGMPYNSSHIAYTRWNTLGGEFYFSLNTTSSLGSLGAPRIDQRLDSRFHAHNASYVPQFPSSYNVWYKGYINLVNNTIRTWNDTISNITVGGYAPSLFYLSLLQYASSMSYVDYVFITEAVPQPPVVSCEEIQFGSYSVGGGTATARRLCNLSTTQNVSDYQFSVAYSLFNSTALYISNETGTSNSTEVDWASPTPANNTDITSYPITYNCSSTDPISSPSYIEINGVNKTCSVSADGLSCSYTPAYDEYSYNTSYNAVCHLKVGSSYYNSTTRTNNYYACAGVSTNITLISNISMLSAGDCFTVTANNITINGNGYTISGYANQSSGIKIIAKDFATIENIKITGFQNAVFLNNSFLTTLYNNTIYNNTYGIYSSSYSTSIILNNTIYHNVYGGYFNSSDDSLVYNNTFYNNSQYQLYLYNSSNNDFVNNIFNATIGQGIIYADKTNDWNTSAFCTQPNIIGGNCIGGNFYSGYNSVDINGDGIGEDTYTINENNTDMLPLTNNKCLLNATAMPAFSLNKTLNISFTYTEYTESCSARVYFDNTLINDTSTNATISFDITTIYGIHNTSFVVFYNGNEYTAYTAATTVSWNITLNAPANNSGIYVGYNIYLNYSTNNLYDISCSLTHNTNLIRTDNFTSPSNIEVGVNATAGTSSWFVVCTAGDNSSHSVNSGVYYYTYDTTLFTYNITLANTTEYIYASPQTIFYDLNGRLSILYYTINSSTTYLNIRVLEGNASLYHYSQARPISKEFFVVFREPNKTSILTFTNNESVFIELSDSGMEIKTFPTSFNVSSNNYYDPFEYANTKWISEINYTTDSFFLFWLPTNITSYLIRKNINDYNLTVVGYANSTSTKLYNPAWETISLSENLTIWAYTGAVTYNASHDKLGVYTYNGTHTLNSTPVTNVYTPAQMQQHKVIFDKENDRIYILVSNASQTSGNYIYDMSRALIYKTNSNTTSPSHLFFIDDVTFTFFSTEGSATYAYSCYFNTTANCTKASPTQYGASIPYLFGLLTTRKLVNGSDIVSQGRIAIGDKVNFLYHEYIYDGKFICYDEMSSSRKTFSITIQTPTNLVSPSFTSWWGFIIPSSLLSGEKKLTTYCYNGTYRSYYFSLTDNFKINAYSLNQSLGVFCALAVYDQLGARLDNALLTAYRFSPDASAWVVVEQAKTDYSATAYLFLQPNVLYKLNVVKSGHAPLTTEISPLGTGCSYTIYLPTASNVSIDAPIEYNNLWSDISYSLTPSTFYLNNATNITFSITSASGMLEYVVLKIDRIYNRTTTTVYSNNISSPSGTSMQYEVNTTGIYVVQYSFKAVNHSLYTPLEKRYYYGDVSGLTTIREMFESGYIISGWAYFFIAVVVTMLVAGFLSQYTFDGAGLGAVLILWAFALINPNAEVVCLATGSCISVVQATIITTIGVAAGFIAVKSL